MNHPEKLTNKNGHVDHSIKSLREQMAQLLLLREQVSEAEAQHQRTFSIVEGDRRARPNPPPMFTTAQVRALAAGSR